MADDITFHEPNFSLAKFERSNATLNELRLAMFAPIGRLTHSSKSNILMKEKGRIVRKTNWGEMVIENKVLTQIHRDILDLIFTHGEAIRPINTSYKDGVAYRFDANKILDAYGWENSRNTSWLNDKLKEMRDARITIKTNHGDEYDFNILSSRGFREEMGSFYIEFSPAYVDYFNRSISIDYRNQLPQLLKIKSPVVKAIIRLELTHKKSSTMRLFSGTNESGEERIGLLEAIGYPVESPAAIKTAMTDLRQYKETLASFGILYEEGTRQKNGKLSYRKKDSLNIKFIPPNDNESLQKLPPSEKDDYAAMLDYKGKELLFKGHLWMLDEISFSDNGKAIVLSLENNGRKGEITFNKPPSKVLEELIIMTSSADAQKEGRLL